MSENIKKTLSLAFVVRGLTSMGSILAVIFIGKKLGAESVGIFAISQSIILAVAIFSRFGTNNTVMFLVGQNPSSRQSLKYLFLSIFQTFALSSLISFSLYLNSTPIFEILSIQHNPNIINPVLIAAPAFSISFIFSGFLKGNQKPATSLALEHGAISLLLVTLITFLSPKNPEFLLTLYSISIYAIFTFGSLATAANLKKLSKHLVSENLINGPKDFASISSSYFLISLANLIQNALVFIIAAYFLHETEVGILKTAHQITLSLSFILLATNSIFPPRFARLFRKGDMEGLQSMARLGASVGLISSLPVILALTLLMPLILGTAQISISIATPLLIILGFAQIINVSTGCVNFVLNMTGLEKIMRNIVLTSSILGILIFSYATRSFGLVGAASGIALMIVMQNLSAVILANLKLKINALPFLNIRSISVALK